MKSQEFEACCDKFQNAKGLLKEALKDIIAAVKSKIPKNYEVLKDQIGYKEQDTVSFKISYGYNTTFTYFFENEKKNITDNSLEDHLGILIKIGSFSFAEIPSTSYCYIMGVTGTLKTLGDAQKKILEESYNIRKCTYMPSVFGQSNRKFDKREDLYIEEEADYFEKIKQEIERTIDQRAVLVFFEDEAKLNLFHNSENFKLLKDKANILNERATPKEKKDFLIVATLANKLSLMPRCFGRGTDFKCRDDSVIKAGGIHVIQTFLSLDRSEELQIQGRCARQGDMGSYSLVLLKSDLEQFLIKEIPENDKYKYLDEKRNKYFNDDNLKNEQLIKEATLEHQKSLDFLKALQMRKHDLISKHLLELNTGVEVEVDLVSRTVCLMDATGSMRNLLESGKKTINRVFRRAKEVLIDEGANPNCFEFQIAFYRNYGSGKDKILEASNWVKKPDDLQTFMNQNKTSGGQGNEAIEIGLWHCNKEHDTKPITQIMIIGDAAPNTEENIRRNRENYGCYNIFNSNKGEDYWKDTQYHTPTYFKKELTELMAKNVKTYPFYVSDNNDLKNAFQELASNGITCKFLDVNNAANGAEDLVDTLAKVILNDIGGEKFQRKYDQKFNTGKLHV